MRVPDNQLSRWLQPKPSRSKSQRCPSRERGDEDPKGQKAPKFPQLLTLLTTGRFVSNPSIANGTLHPWRAVRLFETDHFWNQGTAIRRLPQSGWCCPDLRDRLSNRTGRRIKYSPRIRRHDGPDHDWHSSRQRGRCKVIDRTCSKYVPNKQVSIIDQARKPSRIVPEREIAHRGIGIHTARNGAAATALHSTSRTVETGQPQARPFFAVHAASAVITVGEKELASLF
jgi:hypothetical protein